MAAETEATPALPATDGIDLSDAVALLSPDEDAALSDDPTVDTESDGKTPESPPETELPPDDAPEFWSADDKAAWRDVPASVRPLLAKYEQQRIAYVNEKVREAARAREAAAHAAEAAGVRAEQAVTWWEQNGPAFQKAFADKWSQVDWTKLAVDNPSEWARLRQQRDDEAQLLQDADRRSQAEMEVARQRASQAFQEARQAEHAKLAERLPQYFGADKAASTYRDIGRFLSEKGIPAERINAIHEAPIIELALAAMRFEQAQKQASAATTSAASSTARTTPTRIEPGPANRAGNRSADSVRQVGERFRQGGGASIADAAELIRLSGL